jgi:hypothetical protein
MRVFKSPLRRFPRHAKRSALSSSSSKAARSAGALVAGRIEAASGCAARGDASPRISPGADVGAVSAVQQHSGASFFRLGIAASVVALVQNVLAT